MGTRAFSLMEVTNKNMLYKYFFASFEKAR